MEKCYIFGHTFEEVIPREYYGYKCTQCGRKSDNPKNEKFENTFWESDAWDVIRTMGIVLAVITIIVSVIVGLGNFFGTRTCMKYQELGIDTMYNLWIGCMAKHPVYGWVPVEKYFEILNLFVN